ncbi:MAG TPA: hypothetical protein VGD69_22660 [Herpetosiphonaceae bacterium]
MKITTTSAPATDLGYLLVKHPQRLHSFEASFGAIHVFYPEATAERCTTACWPSILSRWCADVNDRLLIDDWQDHGLTEHQGTIALQTG